MSQEEDPNTRPEPSGRWKRRTLLMFLAMMFGVTLIWAIFAPAVVLILEALAPISE